MRATNSLTIRIAVSCVAYSITVCTISQHENGLHCAREFYTPPQSHTQAGSTRKWIALRARVLHTPTRAHATELCRAAGATAEPSKDGMFLGFCKTGQSLLKMSFSLA